MRTRRVRGIHLVHQNPRPREVLLIASYFYLWQEGSPKLFGMLTFLFCRDKCRRMFSHYTFLHYMKCREFIDGASPVLKCVWLWWITDQGVGHSTCGTKGAWMLKRKKVEVWLRVWLFASIKASMAVMVYDNDKSLFISMLSWSRHILYINTFQRSYGGATLHDLMIFPFPSL